ncbi:MAG: DUF72 domain-containing protein [Thiothrix sp.]|nr:DUF72 domain-containing protein [Thiothrix sp.]HPQ96401.1 DUF72 domain-containing protein [Thiolinea sp.]
MSTPNPLPYYLGAPLWANKDWKGGFFSNAARPADFLAEYARFFNAVEGNTTFYSVPSAAMVQRWRASTPAGFRFSFKFPRTITHEARLQHCGADVRAFLTRMEPLGERLQPFMIQLPGRFGPDSLPVLARFLEALPMDHAYAVEVRHPAFFTDPVCRAAYDRMLEAQGMDRVIFDSRPVHSATALDQPTREAQERKPRLPVQLDVTASRPLLRYIGHPVLVENRRWLLPWAAQTARWLEAGLVPYVFLHTPDNREAPALAQLFHALLQERLPHLPPLPVFPVQDGPGSHGLLL